MFNVRYEDITWDLWKWVIFCFFVDAGFLAFCSTLFTEISTRRIGKKGKAKPTPIHQNHAAARQHKHRKYTLQLF